MHGVNAIFGLLGIFANPKSADGRRRLTLV